jgi:hypothetical protein
VRPRDSAIADGNTGDFADAKRGLRSSSDRRAGAAPISSAAVCRSLHATWKKSATESVNRIHPKHHASVVKSLVDAVFVVE